MLFLAILVFFKLWFSFRIINTTYKTVCSWAWIHTPALRYTVQSPLAMSSFPGPSSSLWPSFLLPAITIPFRQRRTVADNNDVNSPPSLSSSVESATSSIAPPATATLRCVHCSTEFAFNSQVVSKGFTGRHGRAYLVAPPSSRPTPTCPATDTQSTNLVNVSIGRAESRRLSTGAHVVADINCLRCGIKVGWKYIDAREPSQRYKIGKFILETSHVVVFRDWGADDGSMGASADDVVTERLEQPRDSAEFDSEDEDECDELFSGTWDPHTSAIRKRAKEEASARLSRTRMELDAAKARR
ncbi:hypothetical protein MCOR27_004577 [Pyricularia oryzae]|uniref:Yippee domain-containing protein n=2 Tax=Pyricularia TaxID=48558 RepID=A0ABQ8NH24_PYRGI|nr:hypothetical protein MCOR01_007885 [Pyricularia oryzae]KAI6297000.1 hypothetical protein MCOR33_006542 [Pyricularia grisea]KAH9433454.1 hypothetical protein MCOR02_005502 [Pyricularia oryzae]KAI6256652.1 hypothetical protein MCOR19_006897 [Pyricularia oryzae]KAI6273651.1 hypothetical protein MCOR26_006790 [Pyricularia oryzae]